MSTIVVGIDGSFESRHALQWAVREASARHATVRAVHAWEFPYLATGYTGDPLLEADVIETARAASADLLESEVATLGETRHGVPIEPVVAEGPAASALLAAARDAELLILGTRGHGGFSELRLGSVSETVVRSAQCPVVVVPRESRS